MSNDLETRAREILRNAVKRHFPHIAVAATSSPEDRVLVDLLVRVNPDVKILWLDPDWASAEEIKTRYYVTPIRASGTLVTERLLARRWDLRAIISGERGAAPRSAGLLRIHPLAGWTDDDVQAYLNRHAVAQVGAA